MHYVEVGVVAQDKTFGQPYKICSAINNSAVNRLFYLRTCRLAELVERGSNFYWRGNLPAVCMCTQLARLGWARTIVSRNKRKSVSSH